MTAPGATPPLPEVVHEGRGGYVSVGGRRDPIEHVEGGRFVIEFPSGHRHPERADDRAALERLVRSDPARWALEDRSRGR